MRKGNNGFTLIELLVVIAIIAVLAAILFPIMTQAKAQARVSNCLSNLRQIGVATSLYTDNYQGYYPIKREWPYMGNIDIFALLDPYLKTKSILICKADAVPPHNYAWYQVYGTKEQLAEAGKWLASYYYFFPFCHDFSKWDGNRSVWPPFKAMPTAAVKHPSKKAMFRCHASSKGKPLSYDGHGTQKWEEGDTTGKGGWGMMLCFADGHSRHIPWSGLRELKPGWYSLDWTDGGLAGQDVR